MFTGIIVAQGELKNIENLEGDRIFTFNGEIPLSALTLGASVCHNGTCLTIIEAGQVSGAQNYWKVQISGETITKTTLGDWKIGDKVNLEPSLKIGDELGGHIVSGHVDGVGFIESITNDAESHVIIASAPKELMPLIAKKGSIAFDGISLTVNDVSDTNFTLNIIPHTWAVTNMSQSFIGRKINLEIDPLARYVDRWLSFGNKSNKDK